MNDDDLTLQERLEQLYPRLLEDAKAHSAAKRSERTRRGHVTRKAGQRCASCSGCLELREETYDGKLPAEQQLVCLNCSRVDGAILTLGTEVDRPSHRRIGPRKKDGK